MKDGTEVSLETDRLEQLLEEPAPAPPVVMIQYRDRGAPWWVLVPLLLVAPIVAILGYHHWVVERYRAQAADAAHLMETWAGAAKPGEQPVSSPTAGSPGVSPQPTLGAAGAQSTVGAPDERATLSGAAGAIGSTGSVPPSSAATTSGPGGVSVPSGAGTTVGSTAASGKPEEALKAGPDLAQGALPQGPSGDSPPGEGQPPRSRVHTVAPSPFEPTSPSAASASAPSGPGTRSSVEAAPDESNKASVASKDSGARGGNGDTPKGAREGSPPGERSPQDHPADAGLARGGVTQEPRKSVPDVEPLPTEEELDRQIAEEAARKERDMAEERKVRVAGIRALREEDRVKFRNELRQIMETHGKLAGAEIDKLARRSSHDYNQAAYTRAMNIWRHGKMSQQAKVDLVRSMDIPESAILNFMSDNFIARLRKPGGPRDDNEVRLRAAQLLLSYELPTAAAVAPTGAAAAPGTGRAPAKTVKNRETGGIRPQ